MSSFASKLVGPMGLVILVCFFLPWMTVSCSGMEIISNATAFDIAQGIEAQGERTDPSPDLFLIVAGGVVMALAGARLWGSRSPVASVMALLGSALALGIWFYFRTSVMSDLDEGASQGIVFTLRWESGFWGTMVGAAVGVLASLLSFGSRSSGYSEIQNVVSAPFESGNGS